MVSVLLRWCFVVSCLFSCVSLWCLFVGCWIVVCMVDWWEFAVVISVCVFSYDLDWLAVRITVLIVGLIWLLVMWWIGVGVWFLFLSLDGCFVVWVIVMVLWVRFVCFSLLVLGIGLVLLLFAYCLFKCLRLGGGLCLFRCVV